MKRHSINEYNDMLLENKKYVSYKDYIRGLNSHVHNNKFYFMEDFLDIQFDMELIYVSHIMLEKLGIQNRIERILENNNLIENADYNVLIVGETGHR